MVGAPWRCGVLTTWGGIAGIGLGRLLGGEHASTPQSGGSSPVETEPPQIVLFVVVVRSSRHQLHGVGRKSALALLCHSLGWENHAK